MIIHSNSFIQHVYTEVLLYQALGREQGVTLKSSRETMSWSIYAVNIEDLRLCFFLIFNCFY